MRALIPLSVLQSTSIPCFALCNAPALPRALALPHAQSLRDPVARGPRMAFQTARAFSAASPVATVMTPEQKYLFDLNGFIVIRGVLSPEEIKAANAALDAHSPEFKERAESALRNTRVGTPLAGDGKTPRLDMGGMLGWQKPHCDIFRKMLCHPKLVPYLKELVGEVRPRACARAISPSSPLRGAFHGLAVHLPACVCHSPAVPEIWGSVLAFAHTQKRRPPPQPMRPHTPLPATLHVRATVLITSPLQLPVTRALKDSLSTVLPLSPHAHLPRHTDPSTPPHGCPRMAACARAPALSPPQYGQGYRMDHQPIVIASEKLAEGSSLHGLCLSASTDLSSAHIRAL